MMGLPLLDSILNKVERKGLNFALPSNFIANYFRSERKIQLEVPMPKIMMIRGQTLADDIMDIWADMDDDYMIDVGTIANLVYMDFLTYVKKGVSTSVILEHLKTISHEHNFDDLIEFESTSPYTMKRVSKTKNKMDWIRVSMDFSRKDILRGEMLLYELQELDSSFSMEPVHMVSFLFQSFIASRKGKSTESIMKDIIKLLQAHNQAD